MPGQGSRWTAVIAVLLAAVAATGCTAGDEDDPVTVQPGAPGDAGEVLSDPAPAAEQPYSVADLAFLYAMIPHHAQALRMAALVEGRSEREDLALLARRIEISQEAEIQLMEDWLAARGGAAADHEHHHTGELAPGMLTEAQFADLTEATGAEFDRLFLELMIAHHEGALIMVADLLAAGGAQQAAMFDLVTNIEADQRIEIDRMTDLLAELTGD